MNKGTGIFHRRSISFACIIFLVACLSASAQTNSITADRQILTALGWQFAHNEYLNGMDISDSELATFLHGFSLGARDQRLPLDTRAISPDTDALAKVRQQKVIDAVTRRNAAAAQQFFDHWKTSGQVSSLSDGVYIKILSRGDSAFAKPLQTVKVHYIARLINGDEVTEFCPDDVILVTNHLNRGLFEGFQKISNGGKMELYLPPDLAKDQVEMAGAPYGSALIYEVEMLGAKDTPAQDLADAQMPPAPDPPPPAYSGQFPVNDVIETWGWKLAKRSRFWRLMLSADELTNLLAGVEAGIRDQPLSSGVANAQPEIEQFVSERKEQFQEMFKQKQIAAMNALFVKLDMDTNVIKLPDGLRYKIVRPGSDHFPKKGQTVLVNYTGQTLDGHVFDQTVNEPLHVDVGRVMPGWNEGIQKIGIGGRIRLYIPPSLGYGSDAVSGIPADSTLVFDIELLNIEDKAN